MKIIARLGWLVTLLLISKHASGSGLAAKYPGDDGIANDPDVLFADNFESGDMKLANSPASAGATTWI